MMNAVVLTSEAEREAGRWCVDHLMQLGIRAVVAVEGEPRHSYEFPVARLDGAHTRGGWIGGRAAYVLGQALLDHADPDDGLVARVDIDTTLTAAGVDWLLGAADGQPRRFPRWCGCAGWHRDSLQRAVDRVAKFPSAQTCGGCLLLHFSGPSKCAPVPTGLIGPTAAVVHGQLVTTLTRSCRLDRMHWLRRLYGKPMGTVDSALKE